mgnify:CR=1 FL=1
MESSSYLRDPKSVPSTCLDEETFKLQVPLSKFLNVGEMKGEILTDSVMDTTALICLVNYILLALEANKDVWLGIEGPLMGGELASRPMQLIFFGCLHKLSKSFLAFKKKKKKKDRINNHDELLCLICTSLEVGRDKKNLLEQWEKLHK